MDTHKFMTGMGFLNRNSSHRAVNNYSMIVKKLFAIAEFA